MKLTSRLLASAAVLAAGTSMATQAQAQRVQRIVAVGDSYVDDGNVFELTGTPRPLIYPLGRFSNGTNFIDTMQQLLGVPVLNYGIGGAVARAQNTNIPQVQAFDLQVQSFLAGGGPAAFPRSSGRLEPSDLLVVNIGANDARAYQFSLGRTPTAAQITTLQAGVPAQAQLAAGDAIRNLNSLVAAGARNMTVLGGDVGILPEVRGQAVAAVGSAYSTAYNGLVRQALAGYANQGVIVNYLDLTLISKQVENNLAAFGVDSAGACPQACVTTNPELLNRYLVYVDQLHLTQRGYEIVGQYAVRQLEAPLHLEAQGETAMLAVDTFGQALENRLDLASADEAEGPPLRLFLGADYGQRRAEAEQMSLGYKIDRWSATGGVEYDGGQWLLGAAISLSRGETEMQTRTGNIDSNGLHLGAYGNWSNGNAFIEAYGGIGRVELDIRRDAVISEIEGSPEADTILAGAQIGYLFDLGSLKVGPVAGISYGKAEIGAFTETGDPVLTLNVQDQEVDQLVGSLGVELNGSLDLGGSTVSPFLTASAQHELNDDPRTIRYAGTAAPEIVNRWLLEDESETYGKVTGGASFAITQGLTLQAAGGTTFGKQGGDDSHASVALRIGF
ncbi:MAG TPA: autotransporter domain-containing protein [Allosphingosinicella sp.]|nr:autotransporter domain-containing protein [Allosphingosinicella sp.]